MPDTMSASMEHAEDLLVNYTSGFGNDELGSGVHVLRTDGTLSSKGGLRYIPQKANRPYGKEIVAATTESQQPHLIHLQKFFDCVKSGKEPTCPFDLGFRVSVACRMAVDSYRQRRTVRWNSEEEEIVPV